MRQSRRGCFYQSEDKMYVWKIYNLKKNVVEQVDTGTATISLGSYSTINQASAYTINSDGLFSLTSPTTVSTGSLTVGSYLVSLTPGGWGVTPATTGSSLYKITSATSVTSYGSKTWTVGYEEYNVTPIVKGDDTGNTVSSETIDYPIDGVQGDYWYVLIESPTQYIWDVYTYTKNAVVPASPATGTYTAQDSRMYATAYTKSGTTFTLTNPTQVTYSSMKVGGYLINVSPGSSAAAKTSGKTLYEITSRTGASIQYNAWVIQDYLRGDSIVDRVGSDNVNDYPMDGVQGNYWYVLVYAGNPDNSKYVWEVSSIGSVTGVKRGSSSSFTASSTVTRMAAADYIFDESTSTFTLVNPKSVKMSEMKAGYYFVSTNTSANTDTSGSSVYLVEEIVYNTLLNTRTITYRKYNAATIDGPGEYRLTIGSNTKDYPENGESNSLWYKMVKGTRSVSVYNIYNAEEKYREVRDDDDLAITYYDTNSEEEIGILYRSSYTFDETTGEFTLGSADGDEFVKYSQLLSTLSRYVSGKYWITGDSAYDDTLETRSYINYGYGGYDSEDTYDDEGNVTGWTEYIYASRRMVSELYRYQGTTFVETVETKHSGFPNNDYVYNGFWSTFSHSYTIEFDDR